MWGLLNAVAAPVKSAAYQFARNQAAGAARNAGLNTVRALRRSPINSPAEHLAALKLTANVPVLRQGAGALGGVTAVDLSNRTGFTGQIEGALNQVGPAIDRFFSGTPQAIQQFGREQEKKGWGGALELATPLGFLAAPFIPNTPAAKPRMPGLPADYKQTELAAGAAAERFRPGAGFPGQQGMFTPAAPGPGTTPSAVLDPYAAQNRAYQQERARVEAMVKANPDMQKQEIADARAKVRDQGMAIWAAANPELANKVKPGQSGYEAIQGTLAGNMARAGQGFGMAEQLVPTPQGFPTQVPGLPTGAGYSTGFGVTSNLAPGAQTPPPYSTIRPSSELSGLGAAPLGTAQMSVFGQPEVMDPEQFEKLLKMVQK